ncbi:MAG: hypothetical protein DMG60_11425 [Acidobacteria bacterium]|nr:MAG: hypothetical protein DMG60_11425 [Acidobacteriota bacterium]
MKDNVRLLTTRVTRVRFAFMAVLALASIVGSATQAAAQRVAPPATSDLIAVPVGNSAFLFGHGVGTQGYICLPTSAGASTAAWNANNARPEATLFATFFGQNIQIITHFLSPDTNPNPDTAPNPLPFGSVTWQSSFDSSKVWAQKKNAVAAGSEDSCPNTGAIACVLLQSIGSENGPTGGRLLSQTTFIQRLNTKGGSAPTDGCFVSADVGKQALVPYSADYFFFRKDQ